MEKSYTIPSDKYFQGYEINVTVYFIGSFLKSNLIWTLTWITLKKEIDILINI